MKIGKAKYGSDFVPTKYWKLKDGESTYRILPPIGELAEDGIWSMFYKIHYGYRNTEGRMRVFQSSLIQDRKTKMIEVPDAALERIEKLKSELEKAKASGNGAAIAKFKDLLQMYNLDNNHYVNAMDTQGNIGILKLRHRAKQALDTAIKKLNAANIDPLSPEDGRFFTFTRSGNGLDTSFQVSVAQEEFSVPEVGLVKRDLKHKLTPDIISRLGKEARDLSKLFKKPTSDEIARIVKESDLSTGKSRGVDETLDAKSADSTGEDSDYGDEEGGASATSEGTTASGSSSVDSFETKTSGESYSSEDTSAPSAPAPSGQTTAAKVSQMDDQEFQKYLSTLGI